MKKNPPSKRNALLLLVLLTPTFGAYLYADICIVVGSTKQDYITQPDGTVNVYQHSLGSPRGAVTYTKPTVAAAEAEANDLINAGAESYKCEN